MSHLQQCKKWLLTQILQHAQPGKLVNNYGKSSLSEQFGKLMDPNTTPYHSREFTGSGLVCKLVNLTQEDAYAYATCVICDNSHCLSAALAPELIQKLLKQCSKEYVSSLNNAIIAINKAYAAIQSNNGINSIRLLVLDGDFMLIDQHTGDSSDTPALVSVSKTPEGTQLLQNICCPQPSNADKMSDALLVEESADAFDPLIACFTQPFDQLTSITNNNNNSIADSVTNAEEQTQHLKKNVHQALEELRFASIDCFTLQSVMKYCSNVDQYPLVGPQDFIRQDQDADLSQSSTQQTSFSSLSTMNFTLQVPNLQSTPNRIDQPSQEEVLNARNLESNLDFGFDKDFAPSTGPEIQSTIATLDDTENAMDSQLTHNKQQQDGQSMMNSSECHSHDNAAYIPNGQVQRYSFTSSSQTHQQSPLSNSVVTNSVSVSVVEGSSLMSNKSSPLIDGTHVTASKRRRLKQSAMRTITMSQSPTTSTQQTQMNENINNNNSSGTVISGSSDVAIEYQSDNSILRHCKEVSTQTEPPRFAVHFIDPSLW
ncbi:hypothetical protein MIR68_000397 [Amoeboaphelidium protococcarum]|nr:hypothetical protein MIR68_000397 [Amoeboaphelidium protococcarum]